MLRTAGLLPPRGFRRWAEPSLLPGLLAATRTGLTPAGDDKLALDHELHLDLQLLGERYGQDKPKRCNRTAVATPLFVDEEQVEGSCAVFCARAGVDPGGFEAGVAEELGDDHEVGAAAHERGRERVPEDVDGRVVVEAGGRGDAGDDVVRAADAESLAALVEEQRGAVVGAGPVGALGEPARRSRRAARGGSGCAGRVRLCRGFVGRLCGRSGRRRRCRARRSR